MSRISRCYNVAGKCEVRDMSLSCSPLRNRVGGENMKAAIQVSHNNHKDEEHEMSPISTYLYSPPKNIIISHVYSSDNKGDAALTSVLITDVKQRFPDAKVTILKLDAANGDGHFEDVPEKASFMYYAVNKYRHPLAKLYYALYMIAATLLWAVLRRYTGLQFYLPPELAEIAKMYAAADLIVAVGGGYIRSRKGLAFRMNVPLLLHPLLFGSILGKPTVLYPQSVGPFVHKSEGPMVAYVLKRMDLIVLREDTSAALLASLGVTDNVVRGVDSGFLLHSPHAIDLRKKYHLPKDKLLMGVTVRAWLQDDKQSQYEQAVARALDNIIARYDLCVIFIPQVTAGKGDDDRIISHRVQDYMQHKTAATVVDDMLDHYQIKAMYSGLDILLGTRFHSVIFSLTSYVPVLAIEYEHKTSGIMNDLGLGEWVIKMETVTAAKLTAELHDLLEYREQYKAYLHEQLPPYLQQARQTSALLLKTMAS